MKTSATNGSTGAGLVYRGPMVYSLSSNGTLTLDGVSFGEGWLCPGGVRYYVSDRLGSVKAVMDGATGAIYSALDYGEYGAASASSSVSTSPSPSGETYRHRFTGKEDQGPDFGVPYTDFGARHYSPLLRRWLTPDPLSEKYYDISPYAYCANNPVNLVDPDGREFTENSKKHVTWFRRQLYKIERSNTRLISRCLSQLERGVSERKANILNTKLNNAKKVINEISLAYDELSKLESSTQVYNIVISQESKTTHEGKPLSGSTSFDSRNGWVTVTLFDGVRDLATLAHELKHLFQFENGQLNYYYDNGEGANLYDLKDEMEAHARGHIFGGPDFDASNYPGLSANAQDILEGRSPEMYQIMSNNLGVVQRYGGQTYIPEDTY